MFRCCSIFSAVKGIPFAILALGLSLVASEGVVGFAQSSVSARLEIGKPIERQLAGGQSESFQVELTANQYSKINVEQLGVDVVVHIMDAAGKSVIDVDDDPRPTGTEEVELAVRSGGVFTLKIEPKQKAALAGRISVQMEMVRDATDTELSLFDARRYIDQATALWRGGNYDEALPLAEKATEITKRELGESSYEYGRALFILANVYSDNGGLDKAAELYKKGIELKEKLVGKDDISMTSLLNNYAVVLDDKGDYPASAALLERVLAIRIKALGPEHLYVASTLINLGNVYRRTGDDPKARELFQRALEIRQKNLAPGHPDIAIALNNIANTYADVEHSEPLYKQALAIREKAFGPESSEVGQTLYNFATMYASAGDFAKAETNCRRALAIFEKAVGPDHYLTSYPLNLLGGLEMVGGKFGEAEALYLRSIAIKEKSQGPYHPDLGGALANLANLYMAMGETEKAIAAQTRANEIYEFNTTLNLSVGSERQKLNYLRMLNFAQDQTLTLNIRIANRSQKAADLAMLTVLRRKGRVLDAVSDSMVALRGRLDNEGRNMVERLNDVTTKLAGVVINGPGAGGVEVYRKQVDDLTAEREAIENQISRLGAGYFSTNRSVKLEAVKNAIPEDAALIEFALYHPISPNSPQFNEEMSPEREKYDTARYVAYILLHTGDVKWVDLGEASVIDPQIRDLRNALRDPKRNDVNALARALDKKVVDPLRAMLGGATHLLISPESGLNLIPFEALVGENKRYLVEDYRVTYLTGGSDLIRMGQSRENKAPPLIVANPAYGSPSGARSVVKGSVTATRSISDTYFAPLSGSEQEAQGIKNLFPDSMLLMGDQATKASLKKVASPRVLHIATHGFFLTDEELISRGGRGGQPFSKTAIENPLVRSGLALAGANRRTSAGSDGIMSALEASGLDLWGTKLVVLSACDTGVGEVHTGEGVYGLRRSFVEAGAESLVMSLWPVSDIVTRDLMISYYKNLKQGMGRGEALRQVQLAMLKRTDRRHPFYWASFIQTGEWGNLDEKR